jgi:hypothetical protein
MVLFVIGCLMTGLTLYWCAVNLVEIPTPTLLLDALIHSILFGLLAYFLWFVFQFFKLSGGLLLPRLLNYLLFLFSMYLIWIGIPWLMEHLLWEVYTPEFSKILPLKTVYGLLLLSIVNHWYKDIRRNAQALEDEEDKPTAVADDLRSDSIIKQVEMSGLTSAETLHERKEILSTISVKTGQKIQMIAISDVLYLMADGDYVLIHTADGKYLKEQTMKFFEEHLPPDQFVRVHRSSIVQVSYISRIELYEKQNYRITLKTGHQLKASQNGYRQLKQTLKL